MWRRENGAEKWESVISAVAIDVLLTDTTYKYADEELNSANLVLSTNNRNNVFNHNRIKVVLEN